MKGKQRQMPRTIGKRILLVIILVLSAAVIGFGAVYFNYSTGRKMIRKKIALSFDAIGQNIRDIAGVRVICSFESDVYRMADHFLMQDDITLLERKDYIANPKENGYRSLHLIVTVPIFTEKGKVDVPVEVQMRTIAMDFWASLEHKIRYKKNIPEELRDELSECLAGCAERSHQLDIEFQGISEKARNARIK